MLGNIVPKIGYDISGIGAFLTTKIWMLQRAYEWQLLMPHDFKGVIGLWVSQYCQDVEFGDYSITEVVMKHGAFQRFYAGIANIDMVTLTFLAPIDNSIPRYFSAWYNKIIDEKGYYSPKNNYKRNIYVVLYDRTKIETVKFKLVGTFPLSRVPRIRASWVDENVMLLSIRLRVDDIEMSGIISGVAEGVTNVLGGVVSRTKSLFGKVF